MASVNAGLCWFKACGVSGLCWLFEFDCRLCVLMIGRFWVSLCFGLTGYTGFCLGALLQAIFCLGPAVAVLYIYLSSLFLWFLLSVLCYEQIVLIFSYLSSLNCKPYFFFSFSSLSSTLQNNKQCFMCTFLKGQHLGNDEMNYVCLHMWFNSALYVFSAYLHISFDSFPAF